MDLKNRVALVTGANRGIGRALVAALVEAGVSKVYAGTRALDKVGRTDIVHPLRIDIEDAQSIRAAAEVAKDVEILINNAGVLFGQPLLAPQMAGAAEKEMKVNYFGTLEMCRAFAPVLKANGGGAIVNILSILSRVNLPQVGSYSASKAAAFSLTQAMRAELRAQGTLVVGVMPAFVDTDMAERVPLPKMSPAEVALTVLDALRNGDEDVYPGQAATVAQGLQKDPKAVERQFANLFSR